MYKKIEEYTHRGKKIPDYMISGLHNYIKYGTPVGDFLTSVLENNLFRAVQHADENNIKVIDVYVYYIYNYTPSGCWGSKEKVKKWIEKGGLERK